MSRIDTPRGGSAVAVLADLPALERLVIRCLRLWSAGFAGREGLRQELAARFGPSAGGRAADRIDALLDTLVRHARRPLLRHEPDCPCAGSDECVIARFVALAAEGAREDAILIATLMVRADLALGLADAAGALGLCLMRGPAQRSVRPH